MYRFMLMASSRVDLLFRRLEADPGLKGMSIEISDDLGRVLIDCVGVMLRFAGDRALGSVRNGVHGWEERKFCLFVR